MASTQEIQLKVEHLQDTVDQLSAKVDGYHISLVNIVDKKKKKKDEGDENKERGNWGSKIDFLLSCLGYAVGLGNVWRFPFLAYDNGGGAFFIPYTICLLLIGIPIFFLELSLGQFSSNGSATCWKFAPLFTGIGVGMVIVSAIVAIYYNMIIAWALYYLFASFTDDLPWTRCQGDWATQYCQDYLPDFRGQISNCTDAGWDVMNDGACYNMTGGKQIRAIWDRTLAASNGIKRKLPTEEYLRNEVLGIGPPDDPYASLENLGDVHWQLVLCYLLGWIFVALTLSKGVKSSGKVVYFTATFPYLVLVILLIRGVLLDGYYDGIKFYIEPDLSILKNAKVWKEAANQIFFSLSASWGGLITLASYNKFHNDVFRDALIVSFGNCLTSVFAGFVIFSYLGFLSGQLDLPIGDVASGGTTLAFVVYPFAVTKMPLSTLWAIIFFIMLVTLGVDSEFVLVETVTTSVMDVFPKTRKYKAFVVFVICIVFFLLGLTLTTDGGLDMLDLMDYYAGGWNVLIIAICECIAIGWVYGSRRFLMDIETMTGTKVCGFIPWSIVKYWWAFCWMVVTPLLCAAVTVFSLYDYQRVDHLPKWADALGWGMTLSVILGIIVGAIYKIYRAQGSFSQKMKYVLKPTRDWGPALPKHRELVTKYVPGFIVDPDNMEQNTGAAYQTKQANDGYTVPYDPPPQFDTHRL